LATGPLGRSVTDLLATVQELEHLGVGFVSLTEALDLTTPAGRAKAGLLAIFSEFEREILRERTRAGLAQARLNGKRLGRAGYLFSYCIVWVESVFFLGLSRAGALGE
jgi:DNA invertase Pin-like site-specific DNA recombinase